MKVVAKRTGLFVAIVALVSVLFAVRLLRKM